MKNQIIEVKISDIKIGHRHRKDMGDVEDFALSIKENGLLQPIGITPKNELVFGERRLRAYRDVMRSETIPARIIDVPSILHCQFAENTMRKDFTVSERVAIVDALRSYKHGGDRRSKQIRNIDDDLTVDQAAKRADLGGKDGYARAKKVVEKGIPELVNAMDSNKLSIVAASELSKCEPDEQKSVLKKGAEHAKWYANRIRKQKNDVSTPEYETPQWLFDHLDQEFHFTLDAAALPENAKCETFFTPESDGLKQSWAGQTVWCNPPFSKHEIGDWVKKAYNESKNGATTVMLLPSAYKDYRWWKNCCVHGNIRFLHDYVRFRRHGEKTTAYLDVTVVIFGPDIIPGSAGAPIIKANVEAASTTPSTVA
ncbi:DNA N-6-adenine-methyltransferase [Gimesia chilikensis]|uniref:DNA N-6-adenine-methyltransferase (Dam) n=1 Tax=Gimesia chilikensis TaxID=2605989 RepID=A0A517PYE0_9PLAN|nr:DNA N-6-adenine-methyltransferase [Gimesia chilikensis]QDT24342.1 DNA N-6-adenine-methyltransferase (Dam) [Gimesia chilikensis]